MTTIKKIEKLLGITLHEKKLGSDYDPNQKNTYSGKDGYVNRLRLDELDINSLTALYEITGKLDALTIVHSSIPNFSDLLLFNAYYLTLDGVTIIGNESKTKGKLPWHLKFNHMQIDAKEFSCFEKSNIFGFRQVEFTNCQIDHIQCISYIQQISYLILNKITFSYEPQQEFPKSNIYRMSIYHSDFENVSFLPFKNDISSIKFGSCKIGSLSGLEEFPKLSNISMSTDTQVTDKTILHNKNHRKINCHVFHVKKPFDLENILPLKKHINHLELEDFKGNELSHLKEFNNLEHLNFNAGKINLELFLPIASQLKSISFYETQFYNHECFSHFKNLESFKLTNFSKGNKSLQSFERIFSLKNQLKELEIYDVKTLKDVHLLTEFKTLESLHLNEIPAKNTIYILQLQNLKKLKLCVDNKRKKNLNLEQLTNLEYLILETDIPCKGLEQMPHLKSLQIGSNYGDSEIDINSLPSIKTLERLNITNYNQEIENLDRFPNLKYLRIKGCAGLKLKTMKKLEVLDLENSSIQDFSQIETQPCLKKLDLSYNTGDIVLKGINKFPNLEVLNLMETNIKDISDLESLKKLEYLDLYYTYVSDVRVLNTLPNIKEVNLATYTNFDLKNQLERPEIAVYVGLPTIYLSVWKKDEFGI